MGILLLPSLEEKRHITMENLSQAEAELFISDFTTRVTANRTLLTPQSQTTDAFGTYRLLEDLSNYDVEDIISELVESDVPRHRGSRAVFIDDSTDTILVGTAVVYSRNYAMVGFDDTSIVDTILGFDL